MKTLAKILTIGLLSFISLTGCTKSYRIDNKVVTYNDADVNPMVVYSDSNKITYQTEHRWATSRTIGKDISKVKIAGIRKNQNFGGRTVKYKTFPKIYSEDIKKDSVIINRERKNFDYYLNKIDSIERVK